MGVSVVTKIGTVLYVLCTVVRGTITGGITSVTSEQGGEYVFQDGMGSFVTRVSKCNVRSSSEMGTMVWKGWGSDHNNPAFWTSVISSKYRFLSYKSSSAKTLANSASRVAVKPRIPFKKISRFPEFCNIFRFKSRIREYPSRPSETYRTVRVMCFLSDGDLKCIVWHIREWHEIS